VNSSQVTSRGPLFSSLWSSPSSNSCQQTPQTHQLDIMSACRVSRSTPPSHAPVSPRQGALFWDSHWEWGVRQLSLQLKILRVCCTASQGPQPCSKHTTRSLGDSLPLSCVSWWWSKIKCIKVSKIGGRHQMLRWSLAFDRLPIQTAQS